MSEIKTGEPVTRFIDHVAASLWAATQVPEITVAIQSLLKTGFRRALQVEVLVIIPYKRNPPAEFQFIVIGAPAIQNPDSLPDHFVAIPYDMRTFTRYEDRLGL
jgi:hypothetical protein